MMAPHCLGVHCIGDCCVSRLLQHVLYGGGGGGGAAPTAGVADGRQITGGGGLEACTAVP